jgi:hypothetical protein
MKPAGIEINHPSMGVGTYFPSLRAAQRAIRACGGDFSEVRLALRGDDVVDEHGERLGQVLRCRCCGRLYNGIEPPHA